jgi:hypothetical protein
MMELWLVSIPVEGHPLPKEESDYIQIRGVVFHQYNDHSSEYGKRFVASTIVQGKSDIVKDQAKEIIENTITTLTFISGLAIKLNDSDYYLTPKNKSDLSGIPIIGGQGFKHRITSSLTMWYRIGEDDTKLILSKIEHLKPEKKELFDRALKHYRIAVGSPNPFQEILSYFFCCIRNCF